MKGNPNMDNDKLNDIISTLRHCDAHYDHIEHDTFENAIEAIEQLIKERDEARRLHCHMSAQFMYKSVELDTAKHVANSKGWDCYEKETQ